MIKKFLFHRIGIVAVAIIVQLTFLITIISRFNEQFPYFYGISILISFFAILWIINDRSNPAVKIAWIIPILLFPIFGGIFYIFFGKSTISKKEKERVKPIIDEITSYLKVDDGILEEVGEIDPHAINQMRYLLSYAGSPVYKNTYTEYLPLGEIKFKRMIEEVRKAKEYIFLEYFIIEEGIMWNSILEVLVEKVKEGVEVRVMYDDAGCLFTLPGKYKKKLESLGIKCCVFNPFIPFLQIRMNNRDHRKICVVDGNTAFIGGINLADEYINKKDKHGHWKDTALLMKGDAAWSATVMFLGLWDAIVGEKENYESFKVEGEKYESDGYIQPFTDSPLDGEAVGENVYLNLINKAKKRIFITTPYLIIDNEMITALINAAKSGVDVRIITPHIGDKNYVHSVTRSYYSNLIKYGVKIYEYTPGFVHAKTYVVDGEFGVVGTINMDYRSLYLHFECAVLLYRSRTVEVMENDFFSILEKSQEFTKDYLKNLKWYSKFMGLILRLFAPLM